jgi:Arf-GAP/SH3 domain/ANK repeat/PH domain-containing protein
MYVVALSLPRLSLASRWTLALRLWLITLTDRLCYLVSISSLVVTNPRKRTSVNVVPNAFPATRVSVQKPLSDTSPIEFVQDPDTSNATAAPNFLVKLSNDDELIFSFTFVMRQAQLAQPTSPSDSAPTAVDTSISGLTYVYASNLKEVENLVTREFHADPNLHRNANVALVGDYSTGGSPSVSFEWTWKWKPPKPTEDKGGGWRNSCSVFYHPSLIASFC